MNLRSPTQRWRESLHKARLLKGVPPAVLEAVLAKHSDLSGRCLAGTLELERSFEAWLKRHKRRSQQLLNFFAEVD